MQPDGKSSAARHNTLEDPPRASLDASRLEALLESAHLLHASLDLKPLLSHLLRTVMGRLLASKALIAVAGSDGFKIVESRGLGRLPSAPDFELEEAKEAGIEHFLSIGDTDQPVGMLGIGRPLRALDENEHSFLRALLGLAASSISNAQAHARAQRLNQELNQNLQDLRTLLELVQSLTSTLEPSEIARLLALTLAGRWAVGRYAVATWKAGHPEVTLVRGLKLPPTATLREELGDLRAPLPVDQLPVGESRELLLSRQAALYFPLVSGNTSIGMLVLGPRMGGGAYTPSDFEFGAGLTAQATVAFENSWHFQETLEKRKIEQEVGLAAAIQQKLFPKELPQLEGFEMAAQSVAARQVGGDYYDILSTAHAGPGRPHLICVADVSGKGIPASLLMSNIQATLRALLMPEISLVDLVTRTSELLYATTPSNKYATAALVLVDPRQGKVEYVNAGHNDLLLLRSGGQVEALKSTGPPLGLIPGIPFQQGHFQMQRGDLLALYSDGVVEAQNESEEEFGEERFLALLQDNTQSPGRLQEKVLAEINRFAGTAPQHDDITLLLLRKSK